MKVQNKEVVNAHGALAAISSAISDTVVRFRIIQIDKALAPIVESWQKVRDEIVGKYAEKEGGAPAVDENNLIVWREEHRAAVADELEKLNNIENDITVTKFKLSQFAQSLSQPVDYSIIQAIDWLIDDDTA